MEWAGMAVRTPEERSTLQQKGLACMLRALEYQPANSQLLFHTALLYADVRDVRSCAVIRAESLLSLDHRRDTHLRCCGAAQIAQAANYAQQALEASGQSSAAYNLLALLLSCHKHYERALTVCKLGLTEHPNDVEYGPFLQCRRIPRLWPC